MTTKFDRLYTNIIVEADKLLPKFGSPLDNNEDEQQGTPEQGQDPSQDQPEQDEQGLPDDLDLDALGITQANISPEELELGKMAVRAANFNIHSKDVHQYSMIVNGKNIPFEKISDYFEETKNWKPVLKFVEWVMNKYEGSNSKWSEEQELLGKSILQKIKELNKDKSDPDKLLDNAKRITWVRIILNTLLRSDPSLNLVGTDVTEQNLPEIFNMLKYKFNNNSRGLFSQELKGPNNN